MLGFEIVGHDADGDTTVNTNWPRRLSFPELLPERDPVPRRRRGRRADRSNNQPGETVELDLAERADRADRRPAGQVDPRRRDADRRQAGVSRDRPAGRLRRAGRRQAGRPVRRQPVRPRRERRAAPRPAGRARAASQTVESLSIGYVDVAARIARRRRCERSCGRGCCWRHWPCWFWSGISIIAECTCRRRPAMRDVASACVRRGESRHGAPARQVHRAAS